ncbi:lipocalin family protein [Aquimarina intermedia]|uniref:Lipocalin-like protein n=1 Tax=Aquimarina intermedia TaxID=350814 RepID=A0A5S5BZR5_9FLAO|nr:lipocalin family protein [Aquimarina intermedia]TYP71560.1 lipocalin-like protein [Aquimarina intermedia]
MKKILFKCLLATILFSCSNDDNSSESNNDPSNEAKNEFLGQWKLSKRFLKTSTGAVIQETPVKGCNEKTLIQFNEDGTYRENDIYGDSEGKNCFVNFDESGKYEILPDSEMKFTDNEGYAYIAKVTLINGVLEQTLLNNDPKDDEFEVDEYIKVDEEKEFFVP